MTTTELIGIVAKNTGTTKKQTKTTVNVMLSVMADSLRAGQNITITGFGTFRVVTRSARSGRNPQNGEVIQIPERRKVMFKASKQLRNL